MSVDGSDGSGSHLGSMLLCLIATMYTLESMSMRLKRSSSIYALLSTLREAKSLTEFQLVSCSITDEGFMEGKIPS